MICFLLTAKLFMFELRESSNPIVLSQRKLVDRNLGSGSISRDEWEIGYSESQ